MRRCCAAGAAALLIAACVSPPVKPRLDGIVPPTAGLDAGRTPKPSQDFAPPGRSDFAAADAPQLDEMMPQPGVNPFDPITLNNRAVAMSEQGHYDAALSELERAFRLSPDNAVIAANLAKLREFRTSLGPLKIGLTGADQSVNVPPPPPAPPALWQPAAPIFR